MIPRIVRRGISTTQIHHLKKCSTIENRPLQESDKNSEIAGVSKPSGVETLKKLLDAATVFVDSKPQHEHDKWATLPYAEGTVLSRRQQKELDIQRPKIDPRDTSILLFPGDGAQFVGMAKSLERVPVAKDLFDYASEILKYDLLELCNKGPQSQLNDIRYGHVAILTASLANLELLREERPNAVYNCVGAAGFSIGEITALVFAGALQFDQALQLVQIRAEAIAAAGDVCKSGMAKIRFGADSKVIEALKKATEHCRKNNIENPVCRISNFMYPSHKVISGNEEALQYLEENCDKYQIRSIKRLKHFPACHSSLMQSTVEPIKTALKHMDIADPLIQVYSNVTSRPYFNANHILKLLPLQLVSPVKWEQTMTYLYARRRGVYFPRTIICGPGYNLRRILRLVNSKAWRQSIHVGDCP